MQETTVINMPSIVIYAINFIPIILLLITLVIVYIFIKKRNKFIMELIDKQNKILNSFKNDMTNSTDRLATNIVSAIHNNGSVISVNEENNKLYEIFHRIKSVTSDELYSTMGSTKACRIGIYLFHNGTKSLNGLSFLKISCIGEKTLAGSGIKERILKHSNMTINLFDDMYDEIISNGRYLIINDGKEENDVESSSKQEFISSLKIKYSQLVCVYDSENNALGFVLGEFDHEYNKTLADDEYDILKDFSNKLSPVLSFTDYADLTVVTPAPD